MIPSSSTTSPPGARAPAPAYGAAPRRSGLLVALAGGVVLAAAVAVAIFLVGGRTPVPERPGGEPGMQADETRKALEEKKAALEEASRDVLKPPASAVPAPPAEPAPAIGSAPAAAEPSATPGPSVRTDAKAPDVPRAPTRAESPKPAGRVAAAPAPAAKAAPPVAKAPVAATPPAAPAASAERWAQMNAEMSNCSSNSVIPRVQCERRIRARYCDGWWGTVPECPASRPDPGG